MNEKDLNTEKNQEQAESRREQEKERKHQETPASDVYGSVKGKDSETGVEVPTEEAVEHAREWINENQR